MEIKNNLHQQIAQLQKQLQTEKQTNIERNKLLQTNLDYLSRDLEVLFVSKTWKVGYGVVNLYRKLMSLLGSQQDGQYMNAEHFKNLIENCEFYTQCKTQLHPTVEDVIAGKFPKSRYESTQVKTVLQDIWLVQTDQKNDG
ncbi:hypothetical protein MNBD_GAMMA01-639 [hydrothermal vent metagenome]|uniref:Uncharacterized protein n=1 Tax=hydrothermal vent metagenome TaxID=652676 RepID=A0A3B0V902_9ZZZZ